MDTFESLSSSEAHADALREAQAFSEQLVGAHSMPALFSAFGAELPPYYDELHTSCKGMWLKGFANRYLDARKGKERQDADMVTYTPEQSAAVAAFTKEFAMEGETNASRKDYGLISVLGGANQSNLLRVRHAKKQIDAGVNAPYLLLLGSARPLSDKEAASAANYASGAKTEFDLLNCALETEFGVSHLDEKSFDLDGEPINPDSPDAGRARYYELPNGTKVLSVSAPNITGEKRANTADTYNFVGNILGQDELRGKSILAVTTDLYVPFQHADALRLLAIPKGMNVETIGCGGVDRPTQAYAGEINSMINKNYTLDEELWKIKDYKELMNEPEVRQAVSAIRSAENKHIAVGKILLHVAYQAMLRQAELDEVMSVFMKPVRAITVEEIEEQMIWDIESDLAHDERILGGPEYLSAYTYAAERGINIRKAA